MSEETLLLEELRKLIDVDFTEKKKNESSFHKFGALICPNCLYCEFPGCRDHSSLLSIAKGNGHAACAGCVKDDGNYECSTDTSSPWCNACRNCDISRADIMMWLMSDSAAFRAALSVYNASDCSEFDIGSNVEATALVCAECASAELAIRDEKPLTLDEYNAAVAAGEVFTIAHYISDCVGSLRAERILVSKGEAVYLATAIGTSPRLPANHVLQSSFIRPSQWITHPRVDNDPSLATLSMRSIVPDTAYALANMESAPFPFPVWQARGFVGQFGDPFVKNTELEGGNVRDSLLFVRHYLKSFAARDVPASNFPEPVLDALSNVCDVLKQAAERARLMAAVAALPDTDTNSLKALSSELTAEALAKREASSGSPTSVDFTVEGAKEESCDADNGDWSDWSDSDGDLEPEASVAGVCDEASSDESGGKKLGSVASLLHRARPMLSRRAKRAVDGVLESDDEDDSGDKKVGAEASTVADGGKIRNVVDLNAAAFNLSRLSGGRAGAGGAPTVKEHALAALVRDHIDSLRSLKPGDVMAFPGGYRKPHGGHAILHLVFRRSTPPGYDLRESEDSSAVYQFVTCNSGNGLDYHPAMVKGNKTYNVTSLLLPMIPESRMLSEVFWTLYFRTMTYPNDDHQVELLYQTLLPFLAGGPLSKCAELNPRWLNGFYRTPQRAGSCYYRCVIEAARYLFLMDPRVPVEAWKVVSFSLRLCILKDTLNDLYVCRSLYDASDVPLIRLAARQTVRSSFRGAVSPFSVYNVERIRRLIRAIETRLAELPVPDSLQWAPTFLTGESAEKAFQRLVDAKMHQPLLAHEGEPAKSDEHKPASLNVPVVAEDSDSTGTETEDDGEDCKGGPLPPHSLERQGSFNADLSSPGSASLLSPSFLERQGSCGDHDDAAAHAAYSSDNAVGTEQDLSELILPPISINALPDKSQMLTYLPPALKAQASVPGAWALFGGFDSFSKDFRQDTEAMAGSEVSKPITTAPDMVSPLPCEAAAECAEMSKIPGSPGLSETSTTVDALVKERVASVSTLVTASNIVSRLMEMNTTSHYNHAVLYLCHVVTSFVPVPRTLRERGVEMLPWVRGSGSVSAGALVEGEAAQIDEDSTSSSVGSSSCESTSAPDAAPEGPAVESPACDAIEPGDEKKPVEELASSNAESRENLDMASGETSTIERKLCCVWQDTPMTREDQTQAMEAVSRAAHLLMTAVVSTDQSAPPCEARVIVTLAHLLSIADSLLRVRLEGSSSPWAAVLDGGLPLCTQPSDMQRYPIVAINTNDGKNISLETITATFPIAEPAAAVSRGRVLAYFKEREARADVSVFTTPDASPFRTLVLPVVCPELNLMRAFSAETGIVIERTRAPGNTGAANIVEAVGNWFCSARSFDTVGHAKEISPIASKFPEFLTLRDLAYGLKLFMLPQDVRREFIPLRLWKERSASFQWTYFGTGVNKSKLAVFLRVYAKMNLCIFSSTRQPVISPASAAFYLPREDGNSFTTRNDASQLSETVVTSKDLPRARQLPGSLLGDYYGRFNDDTEAVIETTQCQSEDYRPKPINDSEKFIGPKADEYAKPFKAIDIIRKAGDVVAAGSAGEMSRNSNIISAADFDVALCEEKDEEDFLFAQALPSFHHYLPSEASEQLLTALTSPYSKIIFVLSEFVSGAKDNWLQNPSLRELLFAVVMEPGRWQSPFSFTRAITTVPTHCFLLGTPYGSLLNEILSAPSSVVSPLCAMFDSVSCRFALPPVASSTDTFVESAKLFNTSSLPSSYSLPVGATVAPFLFLVRLMVRVETWLAFVLESESAKGPRAQRWNCTPATITSLQALQSDIRKRLVRVALPVLLFWRHLVVSAVSRDNDEHSSLSNIARTAAIHAHIALVFRNHGIAGTAVQCETCEDDSPIKFHPAFALSEFTPTQMGIFLGSVAFINTWYTPGSKTTEVATSKGNKTYAPAVSEDAEAVVNLGISSWESNVYVPYDSVAELLCARRGELWTTVSSFTVKDRTLSLNEAVSWIEMSSSPSAHDGNWDPSPSLPGEFWHSTSGATFSLVTALIATRAARVEPIPEDISRFASFSAATPGSAHSLVTKTESRTSRSVYSIFGATVNVEVWSGYSSFDALPEMPCPLAKPGKNADGTEAELSPILVEKCGAQWRGVSYTRRYGTEPLPDHEEWIARLFEPFLAEYFRERENLDFSWFLPTNLTDPAASSTGLIGFDSRTSTWRLAVLARYRANVQIFILLEHGRVAFPSLAFSTIGTFAYSAFAPDSLSCLAEDAAKQQDFLKSKKIMRFFTETTRFACGNPRHEANNEGSLVIRSEVSGPPRGLEGSLVWAPQGWVMHVPPQLLNGLIPAVLLENFTFELSLRDFILRGSPTIEALRQPQWHFNLVIILAALPEAVASSSARVEKVRELAEHAVLRPLDFARVLGSRAALIYRVPLANDLQSDQTTTSSLVRVLVNLAPSVPGSDLGRLADVISRIEDMSHCLVWARPPCEADITPLLLPSSCHKLTGAKDTRDVLSFVSSLAEHPEQSLSIDSVWLPRLNLTLDMRVDKAGRARLYSREHSDLYISDVRSSALAPLFMGIPHGILMQNRAGFLFVLVPNFPVTRPVIRVSPLTADVIQDRSHLEWQSLVESRFFVYPVHSSQTKLLPPEGRGIGPLLYLLLLRLLHRSYAEAFGIASLIQAEGELSSEEAFMLKMLEASLDDTQPDAVAVRLKLLVQLRHCPNKIQWRTSAHESGKGLDSAALYSAFTDLVEFTNKMHIVSAPCRFSAIDCSLICELAMESSEYGVQVPREVRNLVRLLRSQEQLTNARQSPQYADGHIPIEGERVAEAAALELLNQTLPDESEAVSKTFRQRSSLADSIPFRAFLLPATEAEANEAFLREGTPKSLSPLMISVANAGLSLNPSATDVLGLGLRQMSEEGVSEEYNQSTGLGTGLIIPVCLGTQSPWLAWISLQRTVFSRLFNPSNPKLPWFSSLCYERPREWQLRGPWLVATINRLLNDTMEGSAERLGFLFLVELMQGTRSVSLGETEDERQARRDREQKTRARRTLRRSLRKTLKAAMPVNKEPEMPGAPSLSALLAKRAKGEAYSATELTALDTHAQVEAASFTPTQSGLDLASLVMQWFFMRDTNMGSNQSFGGDFISYGILAVAHAQSEAFFISEKCNGLGLETKDDLLAAPIILKRQLRNALLRPRLAKGVPTALDSSFLNTFLIDLCHRCEAAVKATEGDILPSSRMGTAPSFDASVHVVRVQCPEPLFPPPRDYSLTEAHVTPYIVPPQLKMSPSDIETLFTQPLFAAGLGEHVALECQPQGLSSHAVEEKDSTFSLASSLRKHPAFSSPHALAMLERIDADCNVHAAQQRALHRPVLPALERLWTALSETEEKPRTNESAEEALRSLSEIASLLQNLLAKDTAWSSSARMFLEWATNRSVLRPVGETAHLTPEDAHPGRFADMRVSKELTVGGERASCHVTDGEFGVVRSAKEMITVGRAFEIGMEAAASGDLESAVQKVIKTVPSVTAWGALYTYGGLGYLRSAAAEELRDIDCHEFNINMNAVDAPDLSSRIDISLNTRLRRGTVSLPLGDIATRSSASPLPLPPFSRRSNTILQRWSACEEGLEFKSASGGDTIRVPRLSALTIDAMTFLFEGGSDSLPIGREAVRQWDHSPTQILKTAIGQSGDDSTPASEGDDSDEGNGNTSDVDESSGELNYLPRGVLQTLECLLRVRSRLARAEMLFNTKTAHALRTAYVRLARRLCAEQRRARILMSLALLRRASAERRAAPRDEKVWRVLPSISSALVSLTLTLGSCSYERNARVNELSRFAQGVRWTIDDIVKCIPSTTSLCPSASPFSGIRFETGDENGLAQIFSVAALYSLRVNRISLTRRALQAARTLAQDLDKFGLVQLSSSAPHSAFNPSSLTESNVLSLKQQSDALAAQLVAGRYLGNVVDKWNVIEHGTGIVENSTVMFDPRFLSFEYENEIMMRKEQVELVRAFLGGSDSPPSPDMPHSSEGSGEMAITSGDSRRYIAAAPPCLVPAKSSFMFAMLWTTTKRADEKCPRLPLSAMSAVSLNRCSPLPMLRADTPRRRLMNRIPARRALVGKAYPRLVNHVANSGVPLCDLANKSRKKMGGVNRVHQMLMGAGKTTVVGPLLMLAESSLPVSSDLPPHLVVNVVPSALLPMSQGVLRSRLGALYGVPIRTFSFQRDMGGFMGLGLSEDMKDDDDVRQYEQWLDAHCGPDDRLTFGENGELSSSVSEKLVAAGITPVSLEGEAKWKGKLVARPGINPTLDHIETQMCVALLHNGVLISTDVSLKSFMLKTIEVHAALSAAVTSLKTRASLTLASHIDVDKLECELVSEEDEPDISEAVSARFPFTLRRITYLRWVSRKLGSMMAVFKKAFFVMDEVDVLLHPLKSELNFPIGPKSALGPTPARWQLPIVLIDAVMTALTGAEANCPFAAGTSAGHHIAISSEGQIVLGALANAISGGLSQRALLRHPHLVVLDDAFYRSSLLPLLARWAYLFLRGLGIHPFSNGDANANVVLAYLEARNVCNTEWPGSVLSKAALSLQQIGLINLARDWVHNLLPHALGKMNRVSYGLLSPAYIGAHPDQPKTRALTAVPYAGKDAPSPAAEFAHPDVLAGLTTLAFNIQGLRLGDLRRVLIDLKTNLAKELGPDEMRPSSRLFDSWLLAGSKMKRLTEHSGAGFSLSSIQPGDPSQLRAVHALICRVPAIIEHYLLTHVFPDVMRRQESNLTASGFDLAPASFCDRVVGFSGTPSDMLPGMLGVCHFELGSEGKIVTTLSDPAVMSTRILSGGWTVEDLLLQIATASGEDTFHALIDTGALVMGLSNEQVADFLLTNGLSHVDGVVFLDSTDSPRVMLRGTDRHGQRHVIPLAQCGLPADRRFTFYDQVHTVGIDISQMPNARAMITVGKDLTLRDFSQGAYRMRGIARGQRLVTIVPPEIARLIMMHATAMENGEEVSLAGCDPSDLSSTIDAAAQTGHTLVEEQDIGPRQVLMWLTVNAALTERIQFAQFCRYRSREYTRRSHLYSFQVTVRKAGNGEGESRPLELLEEMTSVFREPILHSLVGTVPEPDVSLQDEVAVDNSLSRLVKAEMSLKQVMKLPQTSSELVAPKVLSTLQRASQALEQVLNTRKAGRLEQEMVNEQEVEVEKQSHRQGLNSGDLSPPGSTVPWDICSLVSPLSSHAPFYPSSSVGIPGDTVSVSLPASVCYSRQWLNPDACAALALSPLSGSPPRLRNIYAIIEWHLISPVISCAEMSDVFVDVDSLDGSALARALSIIGNLSSGSNSSDVSFIDEGLMAAADEVCSILDTAGFSPEASSLRASCEARGISSVSAADIRSILVASAHATMRATSLSGGEVETTSRVVAVSLAEASSIRRAIHSGALNKVICGLLGKPSEAIGAAIRVRLLGGEVTDEWSYLSRQGGKLSDALSQTASWIESPSGVAAMQTLRFLNGSFFFSGAELARLSIALSSVPTSLRQRLFAACLQPRVRSRTDVEGTPVEALLKLKGPSSLILSASIAARLKKIASTFPGGAMACFTTLDASGSGWLTRSDVARGLMCLSILPYADCDQLYALEKNNPLILRMETNSGGSVHVGFSPALPDAGLSEEVDCVMLAIDADRDGLIGCNEFLVWANLD